MGKQPPKKTDQEKSTMTETTTPTGDAPVSETVFTAESPGFLAEHVRALTNFELDEALKVLRGEARRRERETEALRPKVGSSVRIIKGRPKYVGQLGTAIIVRRSRCFVSVPGISSPAYVLISDLELVER